MGAVADPRYIERIQGDIKAGVRWQLIENILMHLTLCEPHHEKTGLLLVRKQRHRSALQ